jgi:hypothetical protein
MAVAQRAALFSFIILVAIVGLHSSARCAWGILHAKMREMRMAPHVLIFGVSDQEESIMFSAQDARGLIVRYDIAANRDLGVLGGEKSEVRVGHVGIWSGINSPGQRVWKHNYPSARLDFERWGYANILNFKGYQGDFPSINGHVLFGGNGDIGSQLSLLRITSGYSVPSGEECCSRQQVERSMSKWVFGAGAVICWLGIFVFPPHRMDRQLIGVALFVGGWFVMALSGSIGFRLFGLSLGRPFFVGATFSRLRFGRDSTPVSRAQFQTDPQPPPGSGSAGLFFQLIRPA